MKITKEQVRQAVIKGDKKYWEDCQAQDINFKEWKRKGGKGGIDITIKGSIIDYVTEAIMELLKEN